MGKKRSDYKAITVAQAIEKLLQMPPDKVLTVAEGNEESDWGVDLGLITDIRDSGDEGETVLVFMVDLGRVPE